MVRGTWHRHGELSSLTADKQTKRAQRFRLFGSELIRLWYRHTLNRHRTNILRPEMWCVGFCTRQTSPIAKHIGNFPENLMFPFQKKRRRRVNDCTTLLHHHHNHHWLSIRFGSFGHIISFHFYILCRNLIGSSIWVYRFWQQANMTTCTIFKADIGGFYHIKWTPTRIILSVCCFYFSIEERDLPANKKRQNLHFSFEFILGEHETKHSVALYAAYTNTHGINYVYKYFLICWLSAFHCYSDL